jgi:hypothetical protein
MRALKYLPAVLAMLGGVVVAAEPALDAARRCTQVKDSLERLVCYDRALALPEAPVAAAAPMAPAPRVVMPAAAAAAPVVTAAPAGPVALGDELVKRTDKEREAEGAPRSLTAQVTALRETRPSVFRLTLDNGQTWQQMDMVSLFNVAVGDTVQIDKGRMGGYRMAKISGNRSGWARVTRLK